MRTVTSRRAESPQTSGESGKSDVVLSFIDKQATVHKAGMTFPADLSERSWERIGSSLRELTNSSSWWLADWLIFGETTYGWRRYQEAIDRTGLDYQTLRNYAWVARRFELHRRHNGLSFAHHAEVARMSPPEQDYWLRKADQLKWSRNELRREVRASLADQSREAGAVPGGDEKRSVGRGDAGEPARATVATLTIELPAGQFDKCSEAAAAHGLPVEQWVAQALADRLSA